ncbi:MAG: DEAD/DEAH box helicase family protein [Polaromonas sp.]|nr:DEAD/DEAH box helicase family protein [Polaromonas sp.]
MSKEAHARIKINKLLEAAGWRFFDDEHGKANIALEANAKLTQSQVDAMGNDFDAVSNGFVDFLLLDAQGFPLLVLEAKAESKNPLIGKEQARKYAKAQNCRFIILSNGNLHYLWDLNQGNPHLITHFPAPDAIKGYTRFQPDPARLVTEAVPPDYIARTQLPTYDQQAAWHNPAEQDGFIQQNKLRFMRNYQQRAALAIQGAVKDGKTRFLLEMATGTGKTLTAAALIKLFLRTGNARRVLFLVDRLELEDQANKAFIFLLKNDYLSSIYKENRDDWRKAEIVVTTVQSLLFNNKYKQLFAPIDFDLVISDEAHRSIGGNARAVFEYFVGYKLGLTATPKDYLKKFDATKPTTKDPREAESRLLLDTYRTFGCETGEPTFRYSLLDGVREGFLINPRVVDARTEVTTQLLSDTGYAALLISEAPEGEKSTEQRFKQRSFEKKFFSESTNVLFCDTLMAHGLRDPISAEFGKTLVFCVSQNHAAKITQILNDLAHKQYPGRYQSDFAVQVTSLIPDAQRFTTNFTNNKLLGSANAMPSYKTSKARVCVTVGMMTTGYDCPDLLNLALMRPVFSPSDFVQIKGRGTRKHDFREQLQDDSLKEQVTAPHKTAYKLFDFFASCEYFEEKFNYDEVLKLPRVGTGAGTDSTTGDGPNTGTGDDTTVTGGYTHTAPDAIASQVEQQIGFQGMKVDRMFFEKFEDKVKADPFIVSQVSNAQWDQAIHYITTELFDKPNDYVNLDKLRRAAGVDRRLGLREILEKTFGLITGFKSKDELLEEEFDKFLLDQQNATGFSADSAATAVVAMKYYFKAYATDHKLRDIIEDRRLTDLNVYPAFGMSDFKAVPPAWRTRIPEYVKDYVPLNQFM